MTTETTEQKQSRILEDARLRLRGISAQLATLIPPADVAGVLLVQALALMHLERDAKACSQWLRDLADGVEVLGIDAVLSQRDLN